MKITLQIVQVVLLGLVLVVCSLVYYRTPEEKGEEGTTQEALSSVTKLQARMRQEQGTLVALHRTLVEDVKSMETKVQAIEDGLKNQGTDLKRMAGSLEQQDKAIEGMASNLREKGKAGKGGVKPPVARVPKDLAGDLEELKKELATLNKSLRAMLKFVTGRAP